MHVRPVSVNDARGGGLKSRESSEMSAVVPRGDTADFFICTGPLTSDAACKNLIYNFALFCTHVYFSL